MPYCWRSLWLIDLDTHSHPWNAGMVLLVLKGDPTLSNLEHIQVDGPGMAYLFFYNKQGHWGLKQDSTETLQAHVAEAFSECISHSAHFVVILLPLAEGWWRAMAASYRWCQRSRTEYSDCPVLCMVSSEPDSTLPLVGSAPPSTAWMGQIKERGGHTPRAPTSWPRGRPPRHAPSRMAQRICCCPPLIEVSEAQSTHHHRRR